MKAEILRHSCRLCLYIGLYICMVVKTREFSENKVLNIVNVELKKLKLHLLPHGVTLSFTYADGDDDLQIRFMIEWKLPLRGLITCRQCRQPKLPNFLYSSNTISWRLMRRANNNSNMIFRQVWRTEYVLYIYIYNP